RRRVQTAADQNHRRLAVHLTPSARLARADRCLTNPMTSPQLGPQLLTTMQDAEWHLCKSSTSHGQVVVGASACRQIRELDVSHGAKLAERGVCALHSAR